MNIVIAGAGVVGESLAEQLCREGHRVAVIDRNRTKLVRLEESLDLLTVHGNAASPGVLERAGTREADLLIAVTNLDEVNLVVGMLGARMGARRRIARLRNREYLADPALVPLAQLGVDQVINSEPVMVDALLHLMRIPWATEFARLAGGGMVIVGFDIPEGSPLAGKSLSEVPRQGPQESFVVLAIRRNGETWIPRGQDIISEGDTLTVLVVEEAVSAVSAMVQRSPKDVDRLIVVGSSRLGRAVAEATSRFVERVILLEQDEEAARMAAEELESVTVLCGKPTDAELLSEAGIQDCDLFCGLSGDDETNILSTLLAKRMAGVRTAVMVSRPEYVPIVNELGVDIVLNPRLVAVSEILMHVRDRHVHAVTRISDSAAEVLELTAAPGSPGVAKPLRDLEIPQGAILGVVLRAGMMHIARGDTVVEPGDVVVVYSLPGAVSAVERLFARKGWLSR